MNKDFFSRQDAEKIAAACIETERFGIKMSLKYGVQPVFRAFGVVLGAWIDQQEGDHLEEGITHIVEAMREGAKANQNAAKKRS